MRSDGQIGGTLCVARPCLWPERMCGHPWAGVCKPKGALLTPAHPHYKWVPSSPSLHKPRAPVLVLTRISSCKEVTIATTRSTGREERGLLMQSGRLVAGIWQALWPLWDPSPRGRGISELGVHPAPSIPPAGALEFTHLVPWSLLLVHLVAPLLSTNEERKKSPRNFSQEARLHCYCSVGTRPRGLTQQAWVLHTHTHTVTRGVTSSDQGALTWQSLWSPHGWYSCKPVQYRWGAWPSRIHRSAVKWKRYHRVLKCMKSWEKHTCSMYRVHNKSMYKPQ